jgi:DNA-directed RNA polymerase subunit RPC12/RpoP
LVIEETDKRKNKSVVWKCQCKCGNIVEYTTKNLRSDGIIQCPNCGTNRQP